MTTVGIGLGCYVTPQANADRGHDITFLLTLTITPQADADRGHDLTFLLTLTITPQANADRGHETTVGIGLECYG
jgi:hypothetical protein